MGNGLRLVDDVTKANSALTSRLLGKEDTESAWYLNGSVFAKATKISWDRKIKFDVTFCTSDLDTKIKKISKWIVPGMVNSATDLFTCYKLPVYFQFDFLQLFTANYLCRIKSSFTAFILTLFPFLFIKFWFCFMI